MDINGCPGCGCEPEVMGHAEQNGKAVGYQCTCGVVVARGRLAGCRPDDVEPPRRKVVPE